MKARRRARGVLAGALAALALLAGAFLLYAGAYYRADDTARAAAVSTDAVAVEQRPDGSLAFVPREARAGLVFYPGGKVEHTAYAPLMQACAQRGILCVLVKMPLRLAVLDVGAADGIRAQYPQISAWYMGGHSLGGSMAAAYLAKHVQEYRGLVLLGSYSTVDLSKSGLSALCVTGSNDGVLNQKKFAQCASLLPQNTEMLVLNGGCHALFGSYGPQKGDGLPTISGPEQVRLTADAIAALLTGAKGR